MWQLNPLQHKASPKILRLIKQVRRSEIGTTGYMHNDYHQNSQNCPCLMKGMRTTVPQWWRTPMKLSWVFCLLLCFPTSLANFPKALSQQGVIILWSSQSTKAKCFMRQQKSAMNSALDPITWVWTALLPLLGGHCLDCALYSGSHCQSPVSHPATILGGNA